VATAAQQPARPSDCAMDKNVPHQPVDHDKMPCCASDCTMTGMAGLAETDTDELPQIVLLGAPLFLVMVKELDSLDWATVDPPPRLLS